jgi:hypothetical protein
LTCRHPLADLVGVPGVVEQVGVDVEGDRDPGVAEDAADLDDVEAEVDDCSGAWLLFVLAPSRGRKLTCGRLASQPPRRWAARQMKGAFMQALSMERTWRRANRAIGVSAAPLAT